MNTKRFCAVLVALCSLLTAAVLQAEQNHTALPRDVDSAVAEVVARLNPARRSIVRATPRDNLFMLAPEWRDDIQQITGFEQGNQALLESTCGVCPVEQAIEVIMARAWEVVHQGQD